MDYNEFLRTRQQAHEGDFQRVAHAFDNVYQNGLPQVTVTIDDDDDDIDRFNTLLKRVKQYVRDKGYHDKYHFWTDGCNYASQDYFNMCDKVLSQYRGGSCWRSGFWTWDEVAQPQTDAHSPSPPAAPSPSPPATPVPPPRNVRSGLDLWNTYVKIVKQQNPELTDKQAKAYASQTYQAWKLTQA